MNVDVGWRKNIKGNALVKGQRKRDRRNEDWETRKEERKEERGGGGDDYLYKNLEEYFDHECWYRLKKEHWMLC